MKKRRMFCLAAILAAVSVVMFFFITRVVIPSKVDRTNREGSLPPMPPMADVGLPSKGGGSLSDSEHVNWTGGSLPHPPGGSSGGSHSEPGPGHYQREPGSNEGNGSDSNQPKPDGTPYRGHPHVFWTGDGHIRPEEGYDWKNPKDPGNPEVVPLPLGTPYAGHPNVVWVGDGQNIRPADDYWWETNDPIASNYRVVPFTTEEKITARYWDAIPAIKDKRIRYWVANVRRVFLDDPGRRDQMSPWMDDGCLIFTRSFLTEAPAVRENLIAFESGKLFFTIMKDKPVKDGNTLETWFMDYVGRYNSTISNMRRAKSEYQNENLSTVVDIADYPSQLGYIFRAQALQLDKPKDKKAQKEWDKALREFRTYVYPLLRGR